MPTAATSLTAQRPGEYAAGGVFLVGAWSCPKPPSPWSQASAAYHSASAAYPRASRAPWHRHWRVRGHRPPGSRQTACAAKPSISSTSNPLASGCPPRAGARPRRPVGDPRAALHRQADREQRQERVERGGRQPADTAERPCCLAAHLGGVDVHSSEVPTCHRRETGRVHRLAGARSSRRRRRARGGPAPADRRGVPRLVGRQYPCRRGDRAGACRDGARAAPTSPTRRHSPRWRRRGTPTVRTCSSAASSTCSMPAMLPNQVPEELRRRIVELEVGEGRYAQHRGELRGEPVDDNAIPRIRGRATTSRAA